MISITDKVDEIFSLWDKPDSPRCTLAIMKNGVVIFKRGERAFVIKICDYLV